MERMISNRTYERVREKERRVLNMIYERVGEKESRLIPRLFSIADTNFCSRMLMVGGMGGGY